MRNDSRGPATGPAQVEIGERHGEDFRGETDGDSHVRFTGVLVEALAELGGLGGAGDLGVEGVGDGAGDVDEGCACVDCLKGESGLISAVGAIGVEVGQRRVGKGRSAKAMRGETGG